MNTRLSIGAVLAALVLGLAACGEASFSDNADAYIPESIQDKKVTSDDAFALSIAEAVASGDVDSTASGVVSGDGAVPSIVVLALSGGDEKLRDAREQTLGSLAIGEDNEPETVEIRGVEADIYEGDAQDRTVRVGAASPRSDVLLIAIVFEGDADAARAALDAMLDAGSS